MELKVDIDGSYVFDGQSFPCPPSAGSSFSASSVSSHNDPFTPVSTRSSPRQRNGSLDYDSQFCSDSLMFSLTPLSTAASGYFPHDMKTEADVRLPHSMLAGLPDHQYPMTPNRYNNNTAVLASSASDAGANGLGVSFSSSHGSLGQPIAMAHDRMDVLSYPDGMKPSSMFLASHSHHQERTVDMSELWALHGDSHVNNLYDNTPSTLKSMGHSRHATPVMLGPPPARRLFVDDAQHKTSLLSRQLLSQQLPLSPLGPRDQDIKREKDGSKGVLPHQGLSVRKLPGGAWKCTAAGCTTAFARKEHMKRHMRVHDPEAPMFACEFCPQTFSRSDNAFQHLRLHTIQRGKNSRTTFFQEAVKKYEEEKKRRRRQPAGKAKRRAATAAAAAASSSSFVRS